MKLPKRLLGLLLNLQLFMRLVGPISLIFLKRDGEMVEKHSKSFTCVFPVKVWGMYPYHRYYFQEGGFVSNCGDEDEVPDLLRN